MTSLPLHVCCARRVEYRYTVRGKILPFRPKTELSSKRVPLLNRVVLVIMAIRVQYEGNNSIGVFTRLTNTYCLVPVGSTENYYRWVPGGRVVWRERE